MARHALLAAVLAVATAASGHEVRPAFLPVEAPAPGEHRARWKQPMAGECLLPIIPVFPDSCTASASTVDVSARDALIRRFGHQCPDGPHGGTIAIDGFAGTTTDVMAHVTLADGARPAAKHAAYLRELEAPCAAVLP